MSADGAARTLDALHPAMIAADAAIEALGSHGAYLLMCACRAGWLTSGEADKLEPLAVALGWLTNEDVPRHRDRDVTTRVEA